MKKLRRLYKVSKFFFIVGSISIIGLYLYAFILPKISLNSANSYYIYDNKDNLVYQGSNTQEWVTLDNVNEDLKKIIVNIEDKNFYFHKGFDIPRIIKSLLQNFFKNEIVSGASSISQQYVKNLYLSFERTWERKIDEAFLTMRLETHYSKKEILEGYLNTIYFGNGVYGIKDAASYYFNKDVKDLSLDESIMLASIPRSPNNYNPISNEEAAEKRFNYIKDFLFKNKIITEEQYKNTKYDNLVIYGKHSTNNLNTLMYYQDAVLSELYKLDNIPKDLIKSGGIRIFTNLDLDTQKVMEESILKNNDKDGTQIASIIVEPSTGKILALAGGIDYSKSQFNRVTSAKRQVGSTIKPFLYYSALRNGMTSASTFKSESTTFVLSENKTYSPINYGNKYANKEISMNAALSYSDNIYAVKTHLFLGEETLVNTLKSAGLKESLPANPSLALGSYEINMLDYANAYATLANEGVYNSIYLIRKVENIDGTVLYEHKDNPEIRLDNSYTYLLNEMMRNTYNYDYVDYNSPTVIYLNGKLDRKYALKSGTTDNDYWLVGYNKDVLMLCWAGKDNNADSSKNYSKYIKNIWLDSVTSYEKDKDKNETWYKKPDNVVAIPMDPVSGKFKENSRSLYYFIKGTEIPYIN